VDDPEDTVSDGARPFVAMVAVVLACSACNSPAARENAVPAAKVPAPAPPASAAPTRPVKRDSIIGYDRAIEARVGRGLDGRLVPLDTLTASPRPAAKKP
jgi:hypothetical protein